MKPSKLSWYVPVIIVFLGCWACSRSPTAIFSGVMGELPESVQIIDSQDQYILDCCIWLHFEISAPDLKVLTKSFSVKSADYNKWRGVLPPEVDWWNPQKFQAQGVYLERTSKNGRQIEGLYTNKEEHEVYYVKWYD